LYPLSCHASSIDSRSSVFIRTLMFSVSVSVSGIRMYYEREGLSLGVRGDDDLELAQKLVQAV